MVSKNYFIEKASKPLLAGIIATAVTRYTYGLKDGARNFQAPIKTIIPLLSSMNGKSLNVPIFTGVVIASASFLADIVTDGIFSFVTRQEMLTTPLSAAAQLSAVSAAGIGIHYLLNDASVGSRGMFNIIGMAVASEIASTYAYSKVIEPMVDDMIDDENY
jgi:hypothetical protein